MKIQINAEQTGKEIVQSFAKSLADNKLSVAEEQIKIIVLSKDGKEVEVTPDRIKVIYNS